MTFTKEEIEIIVSALRKEKESLKRECSAIEIGTVRRENHEKKIETTHNLLKKLLN